MEFCVNDITFSKDELVRVELSELNAGEIVRGHLFFYMVPAKKMFLLLRAGELIEKSFISKYLDKGLSSVYMLEVASSDTVEQYKNLWGALKGAKIEQDRFEVKERMIAQLILDYGMASSTSYLGFVIATYESLNFYPKDTLAHFYSQSTTLYTRALSVSSICMITALCSKYYDYDFLQDTYNACFMVDYGLLDFERLNYNVMVACELERSHIKSGLNYLAARNFDDYKFFKNHPMHSFKECQKFKELFHSPEIIAAVLLHHEKSNGEGFPNGYFRNVLSDSDTMITFSDSFLAFDKISFGRGDAKSLLWNNLNKIKSLRHEFNIGRHIQFWEEAFNSNRDDRLDDRLDDREESA